MCIFSVPPAYNVAAQRALLHRLGRAHSHEGVTSSISISSAPLGFYQPNTEDTGMFHTHIHWRMNWNGNNFECSIY